MDYYHILGVHRNASPDDIKISYGNLAMQWNPLKYPYNRQEAEIRFKEVSEAFEVLSDPEKRRVYDESGKEGLKAFEFRNPMDVFKEVFGDQDQFSQCFGNPAFGGMQRTSCATNMGPMQMPFSHGFGGFPSFGGNTVSSLGGGMRGVMPGMQGMQGGMGGMPGMPGMQGGLGGMPGMQGGLGGMPGMQVGFGGMHPVPGMQSSGVTSFTSGCSTGQSVSTSTSIMNGKSITTKRISGGGEERVEIYEDGVLTSVTVNGKEVEIK